MDRKIIDYIESFDEINYNLLKYFSFNRQNQQKINNTYHISLIRFLWDYFVDKIALNISKNRLLRIFLFFLI